MTRALLIVCALALGGAAPAEAAERLKVVATLSTFADLAQIVGADHVEVSAVVSPKFNPHFIEPKPSDVVKVKRAELFIHAGLDLELWRGPLVDAAGNRDVFPGQPGELDLSRGIELLEVPDRPLSHAEGDIHLYGNPHYWMDPENGKRMAAAIAEKLAAIDPAHAEEYRANAEAFAGRLDGELAEWRRRLAPYQGRELVGDHRAWPYLMRFLGLKMEHHLEPKPGIPPTPKQVAFLEQHIRTAKIPAIVRAAYFPGGAAEALAKRTGARVVPLCQNEREQPACGDYLAMMEHNVSQLVAAFAGAQ